MIVALSFASPIRAQQLTGASVELTHNYSNDTDRGSTAISGSVAVEYKSFGLQFDITHIDQYDSAFHSGGFGLHTYFVASPKLTLGAFAARYEAVGGGGVHYLHRGLQGKFRHEDLSIEAYIGRNTGDNIFEWDSWGVHANYSITPRLSALASYDFYTLGDRNARSIGAKYEIKNGFELEATIGSYEYPSGTQDNIGLAVRYNLGNGVPFRRRDYWALYPNF